MTRAIRCAALMVVLLAGLVLQPAIGDGARPSSGHVWRQLVSDAEKLGLPVKFLKAVPSDFVTFEFDDLHTFAAEYHLGDHRMVLNRTLSFNAAGGTLRSLNRLTHAEMETLYHELFHAYMDYLATAESSGRSDPLLSFARTQQRCHYSAVLITPVVQRTMETEERFLSERESWEALNEAWAVFVGWAVWSQLELGRTRGTSIIKPGKSRDQWLRRLREADREGRIRGYYEPESSEERVVARKRYLATASRVSSEEAGHLMSALGFPDDLIRQATHMLASNPVPLFEDQACRPRS
jgi:hypothetical protein